MDLASAESQIDTLIERRSRQRDEANRTEEAWRESERKYRERQRRQIRAQWYAHEMNLSEMHAQLAAEHEAKALKLLEPEYT